MSKKRAAAAAIGIVDVGVAIAVLAGGLAVAKALSEQPPIPPSTPIDTTGGAVLDNDSLVVEEGIPLWVTGGLSAETPGGAVPLDGVTVSLIQGGSVVSSTVTASDGGFAIRLDDLVAGGYVFDVAWPDIVFDA